MKIRIRHCELMIKVGMLNAVVDRLASTGLYVLKRPISLVVDVFIKFVDVGCI